MLLPGVGRGRQFGALVHVDLGGELFGKAFVEQVGNGDTHMRRVGDVGVAHRIAQPRGLQHQMEPLRAERIERLEIEVFQDVEHHQRGEPLPVRRDLDQIEPAIIGRDRRHGVAAMAREILRRQERAARGQRRRHVVGDLAFVEGARALGGDGFQRRGERRKADHIAFFRRRAVEQIMLRRARIGGELADIALPIPRHARAPPESRLRHI